MKTSARDGCGRTPRRGSRAGQAMVELIVALVAFMALSAALFQVVSLGTAESRNMVAAREQAGLLSLLSPADSLGSEFIQDWEPGPDGSALTRDDVPITANSIQFNALIVEKAARPEDWPMLDSVDNALPALRDHPAPVSVFGLVRGHQSESVPLLAAVQSLLYQAPAIEVHGEAWLTRAGGIY